MEGSRQCHISSHIPGAKLLVLFVHGILEGPEQFRPLMKLLETQGISSAALLLPGHGSDGAAFAGSRMRQWQEYTEAAVIHFKKQYPHVIIVGHSMGGLLAMQACQNPLAAPDGIFALGLPLCLGVRYKGVEEVCRAFTGTLAPEHESARAVLRTCSISHVRLHQCVGWGPQYAALLGLCRRMRQMLPKLNCRMCVVLSADDEFVSLKTVSLLRRVRPDFQVTVLPDSGHFYLSGKDKKVVERCFLSFLSKIQSGWK